METKALAQAELKMDPITGDGGVGGFTGYASTFGNVDSDADEVAAGAYMEDLASFLRDGFIATNHDWNCQIGMPIEAREDGKGLYLAAQFHSDAESQARRRRTVERMDAGKSVSLSIGYEVKDFTYRKVDTPVRNRWGELTDQVRVLTKLKLYEVSLVSVPANVEAVVSGAKSTSLKYVDHAGRVLDDVQAFLARSRDLSALRAKDGRVLSAANRRKLTDLVEAMSSFDGLRTQIEELLATTDPEAGKAAGSSPDKLEVDMVTEFLRLQQFTAAHRAV